MLDRYSLQRVPDQISQLCNVWVKGKRQSYLELCQILENDEFLSIYLRRLFKDHLIKGGTMTLINSLGWEGTRNRLAEAFLHQFKYRKFPHKIDELDLVQDTLDFEKRFNFLFSTGNQRVFLLGQFLNQANLFLEEQEDSILIPLEVDDILVAKNNKSSQPDWLIIIVWGLVEMLGAEHAKEIFQRSKGHWREIENELNETQIKKLFSHMLVYGHAIGDENFFLTEKV